VAPCAFPPSGRPLLRWAALGAISCAAALGGAEKPCPIVLRDVTKATGIGFVHTDGSSGRRYMIEGVCCGLATFDYDGDGDVDIYFLATWTSTS